MEKFEFEYTEIGGLLNPNIEIDDLGKYGRLGLNFCVSRNHRCIVNCFLRANGQNTVR